VFVSLVWLVVAALWLKPWQGSIVLFASLGAVPILIFWGAVWVVTGFHRRNG
jgi:hypothetical protein